MSSPALANDRIAWQTEVDNLGLPVLLCTEDGEIVAVSSSLQDLIRQRPPDGPRGLEGMLTAAGIGKAGQRIAASLEQPQTVILTVGGRRHRAVLRGHRRDDGLLAFALTPAVCSGEEEQQRARFQSLIAHDIRSPLAVIQGYVGLLRTGQAGPLTADQREFLDGMDGKTAELVQLLDDFLDYQRLESGALAVNPEFLDVGELIGQVAEDYESRARRCHLDIGVEVEESVRRILADPLRLRQVLDNLVGNAIKYAESGTWIRVAVAAHDHGARLTVCDGGPGLPPEVLETVFEPYRRSAAHDHIAGMGLGLVVVRQLVEAMGWTIAVDQMPGAGLRFQITLPTG